MSKNCPIEVQRSLLYDRLLSQYQNLPKELIDKQLDWETTCTERGVVRYHSTLERRVKSRDGTERREPAALGDTQAGLWVMNDMVRCILPAMRQAREDAITRITDSTRGLMPEWTWLLPMLSAEKLTVIGVRTILTSPVREDKGIGRPALSICTQIGTAIRDECEFEQWRTDSRNAFKEGRSKVDLAKVLQSRVKTVDRRRFARWRKKIAEIERLDWSREHCIQLGGRVLDVCIEFGGRWFEFRDIIIRGRTERRVVLSDVARVALEDHHSKLEVSRPYLLPMRCPPVPWQRIEDGENK